MLDPGLEAYCEDDQRTIAKEVFDVLTAEKQAPFRHLSALHLKDAPDENGEYARLEPPESPIRLMHTAPPAVYVTAFLEALRGLIHRRGIVIPVGMRLILFVPVFDHAPLTPLGVENRARELREAQLADVGNKSNEGLLRRQRRSQAHRDRLEEQRAARQRELRDARREAEEQEVVRRRERRYARIEAEEQRFEAGMAEEMNAEDRERLRQRVIAAMYPEFEQIAAMEEELAAQYAAGSWRIHQHPWQSMRYAAINRLRK